MVQTQAFEDGPERPAIPEVTTFGDLLRACRLRSQLSQEALAERARVSVRSVRNLERGRVRRPRQETVRLLGTSLGLAGLELEDFLTVSGREYWASRSKRLSERAHVEDPEQGAEPHMSSDDEVLSTAGHEDGKPESTGTAAPTCPYPGLASLGPEEAAAGFFRGRDDLIAQAIARLRSCAHRGEPLIVVGPSGSGKTSLLRAGLIPALAAGGLSEPGSAGWPRVYVHPGADPIGQVAIAISDLARVSVGTLPQAMRRDRTALRIALQQVLHASRAECVPSRSITTDLATGPDRAGGARGAQRVLLVMDQFEELFTLGCSPSDASALVTSLVTACAPQQSQPPVGVVVLGIRADFYASFTRIPALVPFLQRNQLIVEPLRGDHLREAITGPAQAAGLELEHGLVDVLQAETSPDGVPLLAHALRVTFDHRVDTTLTVAGYRAAGGVTHAIATTAEALHDTLTWRQREHLRQMILRMVALGEGVQDTRRRVWRAELLDNAGHERAAREELLRRLVDSRLVTADRDTYVISHEALLGAWPRLTEWLTQDRAGLRTHHELSRRAYAWKHHGRDPGSLYAGAELDAARTWVAHHGDVLDSLERDFYRASLERDERNRLARRRRARRLREVIAAIIALSLVAAVAGVLAVGQHETAQRQRGIARSVGRQDLSRRLAIQSKNLRRIDSELSSLLAIQGYRFAPTDEARTAVLAAAQSSRHRVFRGNDTSIRSLRFNRDGSKLIGTVQITADLPIKGETPDDDTDHPSAGAARHEGRGG